MQGTEIKVGGYRVRLYLYEGEEGTDDIKVEAINLRGQSVAHRLSVSRANWGADPAEKEELSCIGPDTHCGDLGEEGDKEEQRSQEEDSRSQTLFGSENIDDSVLPDRVDARKRKREDSPLSDLSPKASPKTKKSKKSQTHQDDKWKDHSKDEDASEEKHSKKRKHEDVEDEGRQIYRKEMVDHLGRSNGIGVPQDSLGGLPVEILQLIFSYLPIKTLAHLNLVCKHWKTVLEDHTFWHQVFNQRFGISGFLKMTWKQHCISAEDKKNKLGSSRSRRLLWAAKEGLYKCFEETLLHPKLEMEAVPLAKILRIAASNGHKPIIQLLHDHEWPIMAQRDSGGRTVLHYAVKNNRRDLVEYLVESGCDVNAVDSFGDTPLIFAAHHGHLRVAKFLLKHCSAELVNYQNNGGNSALFFALQDGDEEMVSLLLDHHADFAQKNLEGNTPLIFSAINGNIVIVKRLLALGADPNVKGRNGNTPLVFAVDNGHGEVARSLLDAGIDVNSQNDHGVTPLIFAAQGGHKDLVEILLNNAAVIDHRSHKGNCALRLAARNGHADIVSLLLTRGASPNLPTRVGETALSSANKNRHGHIADIIDAHMRTITQLPQYATTGGTPQQQPPTIQLPPQLPTSNVEDTISSSPPCPAPPPPSPASQVSSPLADTTATPIGSPPPDSANGG